MVNWACLALYRATAASTAVSSSAKAAGASAANTSNRAKTSVSTSFASVVQLAKKARTFQTFLKYISYVDVLYESLWVPLYYLIACELPGNLYDFLVDWWAIRNKSLCSGCVKACDYNALESLLCANLSRRWGRVILYSWNKSFQKVWKWKWRVVHTTTLSFEMPCVQDYLEIMVF